MSYHQDNERRQKNIKFISFILFVGVVFYFSSGFILNAGYELLSIVTVPIWRLRDGARGSVGGIVANFKSKQSIEAENARLAEELNNARLRLSSLALLQQENRDLMIQMGRRVATSSRVIIASVLSGQSVPPYENLIIDAGRDRGISAGDRVIYEPNIVLGEVSQVYAASAKVKLYSADGARTDVLLPTTPSTHAVATGFGGGNFYIDLPSSVTVSQGMRLLIPGSEIYILGVIEYIQADLVTSSQKMLARYPVNTKNVRFVHIIKTSANEYLE